MFKFGADNTNAIKQLIAEANSLCAAVAFLGSGSENLLVSKRSSAKILCNLESGATNPYVIEDLLAAKVKVKTNPRLHAKVYLGNTAAIVGSANLSANGLSQEGAQVSGWHEAGFQVTESEQLDRIRVWFGRLWENGNLVRKGDSILAEAKKSWWRRQIQVPPSEPGAKSLLQEFRDNPKFFRGRRVYFVLTTDECSEEAVAAKDAWRKESGLAGLGDLYEDWDDLPENAFLIDLFVYKSGKVWFGGLWKTPDKKILIPYKINGTTKFQFVCLRANNIFGMRLTDGDKALIREKALRLLHPKSTSALASVNVGKANCISLQDSRKILFPLA